MLDDDQRLALRIASVIAKEVRERLALRNELANTEELDALDALADELEDWAEENDTESVLEGLRAVAGGLEPCVVNDPADDAGAEPEG